MGSFHKYFVFKFFFTCSHVAFYQLEHVMSRDQINKFERISNFHESHTIEWTKAMDMNFVDGQFDLVPTNDMSTVFITPDRPSHSHILKFEIVGSKWTKAIEVRTKACRSGQLFTLESCCL